MIDYNAVLKEGLSVMCVGMGTVFTFLCVLIASMSIMSAVVQKLNKIFPEVIPQVAGGSKKKSATDDSEIAAAIVAAMFKR